MLKQTYKRGLNPNSRNGFQKGHNHSEETKGKMKKPHKMTQKHYPKMSEAREGKQSNAKGKHWKVKDTSNMKGHIAWNKDLKGYLAGKKHYNWKEKIERICPICRKKYKVYPCRSIRNKFCSKKCYNKSMEGVGSRFWKDGKSFEPYGLEFNKDLKEVIRNRDRRKCQICEKTELENKEKLHCHHIDYDKKNNNPNNLISLCRSCHVKTNYNRDYWTKYFISLKNL